MAYDPSTEELVFAGPGPGGGKHDPTPCITGWHVPPKGPPTLVWQVGETAASGLFWASGRGTGGWGLVASPRFARLALLEPQQRIYVLDVQVCRRFPALEDSMAGQ